MPVLREPPLGHVQEPGPAPQSGGCAGTYRGIRPLSKGCPPTGLYLIPVIQTDPVRFPDIVNGVFHPDEVVPAFFPAPGAHDFHS